MVVREAAAPPSRKGLETGAGALKCVRRPMFSEDERPETVAHDPAPSPPPDVSAPDGARGTGRRPRWVEGMVATSIAGGLSVLLRLPDLLAGTVPTDPAQYLAHPVRLYYLFSLDLFVLLSLLATVPFTQERSRLRALIVGSIFVLLSYRTYDAVVTALLHRSPIFYADASHFVGAVYLLANASLPWPHVVMGGAGLALAGLLGWGLPAGVRRVHRWVRTASGRRLVLAANALVWPIVGTAVLAERGAYLYRQTYRSVCLSTTECLVRNVEASLTLQGNLARRSQGAVDSTYASYWKEQWRQPPSLYLVMVESYGMALAGPAGAPGYGRFMARTSDSLRTAGWHMASAQSTAPVFGGLSWLSAASLLLGTPVKHQPVLDVLRPTLPRYPHLVRLLQHHGYETATLQPPVRPRPGLSVDNRYGFDRTFYLEDLNYRGPRVGWGIVPDQYSLAVAHERFVAPASPPFFLFFETVTSHAPWTAPPPPLVDDPLSMGRSGSSASPSATEVLLAPGDSPSWADVRSRRTRLFRHVQYTWRMLRDYLRRKAPPNSLVVVVGDHQPYFADTESAATPVHLLSRDEALIRRLGPYGFERGLQPKGRGDSLRHAGLYSLLVRVLAAHDADRRSTARPTADPLPYRPRGVGRPALLPPRP